MPPGQTNRSREDQALYAGGRGWPRQELSALNDEMARIARERTLPMATEMEILVNKIVDMPKHKAEDAQAHAAAMAECNQYVAIGIGVVTAILLLGSAMFAFFTIAKPMRALTGGMLELADGNFDVVLPGLGRKDEIGDVAAAVETFKVKSAEKARAEAHAKAAARPQGAADKAERDRIDGGAEGRSRQAGAGRARSGDRQSHGRVRCRGRRHRQAGDGRRLQPARAARGQGRRHPQPRRRA